MLIVAADRAELKPLARRLEKPEPAAAGLPWAVTGRLGTLPAALVASGAGRANASRTLRQAGQRWMVRAIVSTGWCGALDPALEVGQVVVASRVLSENPPAEYPALPVPGEAVRGTVLTVDRFVGTAEEKSRLRSTGAIAVEMEAAAVAAEAARLGAPFFCVRAVSDPAGRTFRMDFNQARRSDGTFSVPRIVARAALSPARWGELIEMGRAARSSAEALGEFLGSCRFDC